MRDFVPDEPSASMPFKQILGIRDSDLTIMVWTSGCEGPAKAAARFTADRARSMRFLRRHTCDDTVSM